MRAFSDIDEEQERIVVTFLDEVTLYDITEMVSTSGKARVLHYPLLVDARQARFKLEPEDSGRFYQLVKNLSGQSRLGQTAVLVAEACDRDAVGILSQQAERHCRVQAFTDRTEAEHWLGWATPAAVCLR